MTCERHGGGPGSIFCRECDLETIAHNTLPPAPSEGKGILDPSVYDETDQHIVNASTEPHSRGTGGVKVDWPETLRFFANENESRGAHSMATLLRDAANNHEAMTGLYERVQEWAMREQQRAEDAERRLTYIVNRAFRSQGGGFGASDREPYHWKLPTLPDAQTVEAAIDSALAASTKAAE